MTEEEKTYKRLKTIRNNMLSRCYDKNAKDYKYYGEKGIKVCGSWIQSLATFSIWALMNGYNNNLTLDRIDNSKGYFPDNCRWVTMCTQNRNRSQNRIIEINGEKMCLKDWCKRMNLPYGTIFMRIKRGMTEKEALGINEKNDI